MARELTGAKQALDLDDVQVAEYLREHPNFLNQHPTLLSHLEPPGREFGSGVEDLQMAMLERLKDENKGMKSRQRELITTGRNNLTTQARIHECVLALLDAKSFEQLIQTVTTDFAVLLDLDVISLCVESGGTDAAPLRTRGLQILQPGMVDELIGANRHVILRSDVEGDPEIFAGGATLVRSDALARVTVSQTTPLCMMAFGSRHATTFHPGQATDLLAFLARVSQNIIRLWLELPG